ncbi:MAG: diacylglycerol kinase [Gemmatimonadaceae bacterium]|nr:diacylglycerol kinase [Gemmatimonadaceae bacterium]
MTSEGGVSEQRAALGHALPVIINPAAGSAPDVLEALREAGGFDVIETDADGIAGAIQDSVVAGHRRIVVAGGDGTVGAAAAELVGLPMELAVIPAGTLNHFARDHGIPVDVAEAITLAKTGVARPADVARVNGRIFLNTSSVGAYVAFVRARDRIEGTYGYRIASLLAAVRTYFGMHRFAVEVAGPDGPRAFRTPLLFIGVGERELQVPTLGGRVAEGERGLHVMVVRGRTRGAVLALALGAAIRGLRGVPAPRLEALLLDRCVVTLRKPALIATDGEIAHLDAPFEYELLRDAIQLVQPDVGGAG